MCFAVEIEKKKNVSCSVSRRLLCQLFRTFSIFFFSLFKFLTGLKKLHFFYSFPFLCTFSSFFRDKDTVLELTVIRESQPRSFRALYQLH